MSQPSKSRGTLNGVRTPEEEDREIDRKGTHESVTTTQHGHLIFWEFRSRD